MKGGSCEEFTGRIIPLEGTGATESGKIYLSLLTFIKFNGSPVGEVAGKWKKNFK